MELNSFLKKENIIILENSEKQLVIRELLQKLEENKLIESSGKFYTQVMYRESLETTGIGKGFAIPHVRTEAATDFISIFGISREGIDYQSIDKIPVNYLLLSIFPTEMSTKYLYLIGMMARLFSDDDKIKKLNAAKTPAKIYSVLENNFKTHFEEIIDKKGDDSNLMESLSGISSSELDLLIRLHRLYHIFDEGNQSDSIKTKIEQLKNLIDNKSLTYYERMRKKCRDPFSIVEKSSCSGCYLEIPANNIKVLKEERKIVLCPHCGRFLILL